jgi:hypothetical protein
MFCESPFEVVEIQATDWKEIFANHVSIGVGWLMLIVSLIGLKHT